VPDIPFELERIVRKALQKDREERYQVVKDLQLDLKTLKRDLDISTSVERSGSLNSQPYLSLGTANRTTGSAANVSIQASTRTQLGSAAKARWLWLAALIPLSVIGWYWWRQRRETYSTRPASLTITQLTSRKKELGESDSSHARFSPDGKFVAYASTRDGNSGIWLKQVASGEPFRNRSEQGIVSSPIWSPDGQQIAYLSKRDTQNGIWTMPAFGGSPTLVKALDSFSSELIAWSTDGKNLFCDAGKPLRTRCRLTANFGAH
jgi:WD40 repeat protein